MADIVLTARTPLNGASMSVAGCTLREVTDRALTSFACPLDGDAAFAARLKKDTGLERPGAQNSTHTADRRAVPLTPEQILVLHPEGEVFASDADAYTTDQTGSWCVLELSGPLAVEALRRLCPLDIDTPHFPVDASARTVMEHLGAILIRTGATAFILMSASSSAESFWHAVETSLRNVAPST